MIQFSFINVKGIYTKFCLNKMKIYMEDKE